MEEVLFILFGFVPIDEGEKRRFSNLFISWSDLLIYLYCCTRLSAVCCLLSLPHYRIFIQFICRSRHYPPPTLPCTPPIRNRTHHFQTPSTQIPRRLRIHRWGITHSQILQCTSRLGQTIHQEPISIRCLHLHWHEVLVSLYRRSLGTNTQG